MIVETLPAPGLYPIAQAEVCAPKDFAKYPVNSCPMRLDVQVRPINIKERWLVKRVPGVFTRIQGRHSYASGRCTHVLFHGYLFSFESVGVLSE